MAVPRLTSQADKEAGSMTPRTITATTVTTEELVTAQGGIVQIGGDEIVWVECPADYDPEAITAEDIIYDPEITVVEPGSRWLIDADTHERIGVATPHPAEARDEAAERGEPGIIVIDANGEVVHPGEEDEPWTVHPLRRVYVKGEPSSLTRPTPS